MTYELLNEAEGGELTAVPSVQWVTDVVRGSSTISFSVLKNLDTEPRETSLAVTYTYGDKEISRNVTISQEAGSPAAEYDYDKTIPGFMGVYYGVYGTDSPKFYLALSDMELIGGMMTQDGVMTYMLTFYTLDAVLVDSTGKTHHIVYTGPGNCMNYAG